MSSPIVGTQSSSDDDRPLGLSRNYSFVVNLDLAKKKHSAVAMKRPHSARRYRSVTNSKSRVPRRFHAYLEKNQHLHLLQGRSFCSPGLLSRQKKGKQRRFKMKQLKHGISSKPKEKKKSKKMTMKRMGKKSKLDFKTNENTMQAQKWSHLFDDLPSLPDTLSRLPLHRQHSLGRYHDKTRRFWNQQMSWQLFARQLTDSKSVGESSNVAFETDVNGTEDFDESWSQIENVIKRRHGEERSLEKSCNRDFSMQRYERKIYTKKRDELLHSLEGTIDKSQQSSNWQLFFEAHSSARCHVYGMARKIQFWWRSLKKKLLPFKEHSWLQRMWERHNFLHARLHDKILGSSVYIAESEGDIANLTYAEAFSLRDDRTKPTGVNIRPRGGKISEAQPMSYIDWSIKKSKMTPAPDFYQRPLKQRFVSGGQFSTAHPQTEIEHIFAHGDETPGPAAYNPRPLPRLKAAARISDAYPKSYIDWAIYYNRGTPGPMTYDTSLCK